MAYEGDKLVAVDEGVGSNKISRCIEIRLPVRFRKWTDSFRAILGLVNEVRVDHEATNGLFMYGLPIAEQPVARRRDIGCQRNG